MEEKNSQSTTQRKEKGAQVERPGKDSTEVCMLGRVEILQVKFGWMGRGS